MAYDNLKLDKGLYTCQKGFNAALEAIDPSDKYGRIRRISATA